MILSKSHLKTYISQIFLDHLAFNVTNNPIMDKGKFFKQGALYFTFSIFEDANFCPSISKANV